MGNLACCGGDGLAKVLAATPKDTERSTQRNVPALSCPYLVETASGTDDDPARESDHVAIPSAVVAPESRRDAAPAAQAELSEESSSKANGSTDFSITADGWVLDASSMEFPAWNASACINIETEDSESQLEPICDRDNESTILRHVTSETTALAPDATGLPTEHESIIGGVIPTLDSRTSAYDAARSCSKGHVLQCFSPSRKSRIICDLCQGSEIRSGRFGCHECNYDLCTSCGAKVLSSIAKVEQNSDPHAVFGTSVAQHSSGCASELTIVVQPTEPSECGSTCGSTLLSPGSTASPAHSDIVLDVAALPPWVSSLNRQDAAGAVTLRVHLSAAAESLVCEDLELDVDPTGSAKLQARVIHSTALEFQVPEGTVADGLLTKWRRKKRILELHFPKQ